MGSLFSTLIATIKAKFTSIWTKIVLFTNPTFWRTQVFTRIRQALNKLFNVRPRHKKDYYTIFRWMVSKKLAFSLVVILGLLCLYFVYLTLPSSLFSSSDSASDSIRTYKYSSIPLKFYEGQVNILAEEGYVAYTGYVADAYCEGSGTLYNENGIKVYAGAFSKSMYNGQGTEYYSDDLPRYVGTFVDNIYQGTGTYYRPTGTVEYEGNFMAGNRSGVGTLYNASSNPIYTGDFLMDDIVYSAFLGKSTTQVATMYTGDTQVYSTDNEYSVSMDEIDAVYSVASGANALDEAWIVDGIFVLQDSFPVEGQRITSINDLTTYFGHQPDYYGTAWVNLSETVAANLLAQDNANLIGKVDITSTSTFDNVYNVSYYDYDFQIYIYTYELDGLLYTFYATGSGIDSFVMYAIETT